MGRAPCCEKIGLKKGPWTPEEDQMLIDFIKEHGHGSWRALPKKAGLLRCGKSCRLRWTNYLRPDIKRGKFCLTEEQTIIQLHALLGNRWSTIASHLPKRTDNEIKNYWNTHLKKRLVKMGIDPETHKPKTETPTCLLETSITGNSSISHMAQWESARLEAEARLARESKLRAKGVWQSCPEAVSPNDSSSVNPWNPQASDPSSKPDHDVFGTAACKPLGAVDLMDSLQNWDESLQGQARLMWPETWNSTTVANGHDSSCCCTSPHTDPLDQGSPTSTLSPLEINRQHATQPVSSPALQIRRLSWTDILAGKEKTAVALKSDSFSSLGSVNFSEHSNDPHVGDIFQHACAGMSGGLNVESLSSSQSFQDLVFTEETAILSPSRTSSPWSHDSSDDDFSMDVQKRDHEGIPALASATTSSSLLDDLELVSEDISSNKSSFSSVDCGVISGEFLGDFSRQHHDLACESARQDSLSALVTEEIPDYWTSMLKQLVESPM